MDDLLPCVTSLSVLGNEAFSLVSLAISVPAYYATGNGLQSVKRLATSPAEVLFCPGGPHPGPRSVHVQLDDRPLTGYPYPFLLHCLFF